MNRLLNDLFAATPLAIVIRAVREIRRTRVPAAAAHRPIGSVIVALGRAPH